MKYPCRIFQAEVDGHIFWVAESECLIGCVGQGDTSEAAMSALEENEREWLETASELHIPIPSMQSESLNKEYSGKLTLRVSPSVHRKASQNAKQEGISLNQYLNDAIVTYNTEFSTGNLMASKLKETIFELRSLLSTKETASEAERPTVLSLNLSAPPPYDVALTVPS